MMMAATRLDVAAVFVYAGSILPGKVGDRDVTIIDAFEAVRSLCARGLITREEVDEIERAICPGEGACGGMYTANTMASIGSEGDRAVVAGFGRRPPSTGAGDTIARRSGEAVVNLIRRGSPPADHDAGAFENAITVLMALGALDQRGAAPARDGARRRVEARSSGPPDQRQVPLLGDLKPFGRYVMSDVDRVGGVPVVEGTA